MTSPRNFLQDSKRDRIAKPIKECQITSDRLYYAGIDNERLSRRSYVIQPPLYYNYQCEMSAPRSVVSPRHHFVDPLTAEAYEGLRIILCKSQATLMLAHVLTSEEGNVSYVGSLLGVTQRKGCVDDGSGAPRTRGEGTGLI